MLNGELVDDVEYLVFDRQFGMGYHHGRGSQGLVFPSKAALWQP